MKEEALRKPVRAPNVATRGLQGFSGTLPSPVRRLPATGSSARPCYASVVPETTGERSEAPRPIAPPPVLALACALGGIGIDRLLALSPLPREYALPLGICALAAALAVFLTALREFRRFATTVHPYRRATSLLTTGPFRWSRNPLYVGLCFLQLGVGSVLSSPGIVTTVPVLVLVLTYGVIAREEEHLRLAFGEEYQRYRRSVRRWI